MGKAAELTIPFRRIEKIEVKNEKEDRLEVRVTLLAGEGGEKKAIEGTVKAGLELRGSYQDTKLRATVKLREVVSLTLQPRG